MNHIQQRSTRAIASGAIAALGVVIPVLASSADQAGASSPASTVGTKIHVQGDDNIFGAGLSQAPNGGTIPVKIALPKNTKTVTFSKVKGTVSYWSTTGESNGPDGQPSSDVTTNIDAAGGISGLVDSTHNYFYMLGVFLDKTQPATPPPSLDFTNDYAFKKIKPELGQVFFIGDGLTGTGTGSTQKFIVPAGATALYLGFADACGGTGGTSCWSDDIGSLKGQVHLAS